MKTSHLLEPLNLTDYLIIAACVLMVVAAGVGVYWMFGYIDTSASPWRWRSG